MQKPRQLLEQQYFEKAFLRKTVQHADKNYVAKTWLVPHFHIGLVHVSHGSPPFSAAKKIMFISVCSYKYGAMPGIASRLLGTIFLAFHVKSIA